MTIDTKHMEFRECIEALSAQRELNHNGEQMTEQKNRLPVRYINVEVERIEDDLVDLPPSRETEYAFTVWSADTPLCTADGEAYWGTRMELAHALREFIRRYREDGYDAVVVYPDGFFDDPSDQEVSGSDD